MLFDSLLFFGQIHVLPPFLHFPFYECAFGIVLHEYVSNGIKREVLCCVEIEELPWLLAYTCSCGSLLINTVSETFLECWVQLRYGGLQEVGLLRISYVSCADTFSFRCCFKTVGVE
jgi:hypothetical protein